MDYIQLAYLVKDVGMKCGANRKCANSLTETQKLLSDLMFVEAELHPACKSQLLHITYDQAMRMHTKTCICIPRHAYAYQDRHMHIKACICIPRLGVTDLQVLRRSFYLLYCKLLDC